MKGGTLLGISCKPLQLMSVRAALITCWLAAPRGWHGWQAPSWSMSLVHHNQNDLQIVLLVVRAMQASLLIRVSTP